MNLFKANSETKKFTENLRFEKQIHYSLKSEIIGFLRFRLHSMILIIEIAQILINQFKIKKFVVSGLKKEPMFFTMQKFVLKQLKNFFQIILIL